MDFLVYQSPHTELVYLFLEQKPQVLSLPCLHTSLSRLLEERET